MIRGSRSRAFVLSVLCFSEKSRKEGGSRQRSKIQSSLEKGFRQGDHPSVCVFWIYTFSAPPKTKDIKDNGMSSLECTVDQSILSVNFVWEKEAEGFGDQLKVTQLVSRLYRKPVFSLLIHAFCEQFQAVLSRDCTPLKPILYPFLCSPAPYMTHIHPTSQPVFSLKITLGTSQGFLLPGISTLGACTLNWINPLIGFFFPLDKPSQHQVSGHSQLSASHRMTEGISSVKLLPHPRGS